jgi:hypothetical protein
MSDVALKTVMTHMNILEDNMIALYQKVNRFIQDTEKSVDENKLKNLSERAKYIRKLDTMKKVITDKCTCGEHVGIRFVDENGTVVEDHMCPKDWWVYKSRLAYLDGELDTFLDTTPIETYLNYGKKDK